MTPLTDSKLGNVNNPLSLSIYPAQTTDINNRSMDLDVGDISRFLLFAIKRWSKAGFLLPDDAVDNKEELKVLTGSHFSMCPGVINTRI
jgi:hypothetical protein